MLEFLLIVFICLLFLKYLQTRNARGRLNLPPGRMGIPMLGESLQFLRKKVKIKVVFFIVNFLKMRLQCHCLFFKCTFYFCRQSFSMKNAKNMEIYTRRICLVNPQYGYRERKILKNCSLQRTNFFNAPIHLQF